MADGEVKENGLTAFHTHDHAVEGQLAVHFELVCGRHPFAGVQEHV